MRPSTCCATSSNGRGLTLLADDLPLPSGERWQGREGTPDACQSSSPPGTRRPGCNRIYATALSESDDLERRSSVHGRHRSGGTRFECMDRANPALRPVGAMPLRRTRKVLRLRAGSAQSSEACFGLPEGRLNRRRKRPSPRKCRRVHLMPRNLEFAGDHLHAARHSGLANLLESRECDSAIAAHPNRRPSEGLAGDTHGLADVGSSRRSAWVVWSGARLPNARWPARPYSSVFDHKCGTTKGLAVRA